MNKQILKNQATIMTVLSTLCQDIELLESLSERVKETKGVLYPPTNNLAEKRAEEIKVKGCGGDSGFISLKLQREYRCGEINPTTNKVVLCSECSQSGSSGK